MGAPTIIIFHPPPIAPGGPLSDLLASARDQLVAHQTALFMAAGAGEVRIERERGASFGDALRDLADRLTPATQLASASPSGHTGPSDHRGLVVLGAGAVPLLSPADARRLVAVAGSGERRGLSNNRYSSDVCAIGDAGVLRDLPALPGDNALPRWLAERAATPVAELPGRDRLALDLDTPLDLAILAMARGCPAPMRRLARRAGLAVPRLTALRALLGDPTGELLVFGRASSRGMALLERRAACRVRFLAEERGLRASTRLAPGGVQGGAPGSAHAGQRPPRATLGRLLEARGGPPALASTVAELGDGAVLDTRVLLADRLGPDEGHWPSPEDRYASDLLRPATIVDPWLRDLTASAAGAPIPILLGGHTLVGPGLRVLVGARVGGSEPR
jgi:CTP:molybdopterin cytidylyltransferase MocA